MIVPIALSAAPLALSVMAKAIKALYGMATEIDEYLDHHIEDMKGSDNPTISRTGRILEMAKLGFGIGYITPVVIITVGQLLLGNPLAAITTVATAATLSNPLAMTCAAVGAIYYGWGALSDVERTEMLRKLSKGLEIGIELIQSVVRFVVDQTKELLSSKNIEEMKKFIGSAAAVFGKSLSDVTHKISDVVGDTFNVFKKKSGSAVEMTIEAATEAYEAVATTTAKVGNSVDTLKDKVGNAVVKTKHVASGALQTASASVAETTDSIHEKLEKVSRKLRKDELPKNGS